jgi:hypothetical protein
MPVLLPTGAAGMLVPPGGDVAGPGGLAEGDVLGTLLLPLLLLLMLMVLLPLARARRGSNMGESAAAAPVPAAAGPGAAP